jgi:hypothetical protein
MVRYGFCLILTLALVGCQMSDRALQQSPSSADLPTPITPKPSNSPTTQSSPTSASSQPSERVAANVLISPQGIGPARLGMTIQQLKQTLDRETKFEVKSPFMVDLDAMAVYQSGQLQYYILYPAGTTLADTAKIVLLLTDNPKYRTAAGIGVGTSLTQAVAAYGTATLSYNTENESREQVSFAKHSDKNIIFQPGTSAQTFAGIYPTSAGEYHETKVFQNSAMIRAIWVGQ